MVCFERARVRFGANLTRGPVRGEKLGSFEALSASNDPQTSIALELKYTLLKRARVIMGRVCPAVGFGG